MKRYTATSSFDLRRAGCLAVTVLLGLVAGCSKILDDNYIPECGNGVAEGYEVCDGVDWPEGIIENCGALGYDDGFAWCSLDCQADGQYCYYISDTVCPNGVCEEGEDEYSCIDDCWVRPATCGNGVIDASEMCDNPLGTTCEDLGYSGGTLECYDDCRFFLEDCYRSGHGQPCLTDDNCSDDGICYRDANLPNGYCTATCPVNMCGSTGECRANDPMYGPWCYGICATETDCATGLECVDGICWHTGGS